MRAGMLRRRVTLQKRGPIVVDSEGNATQSWPDVGRVWADVVSTSAQERLLAAQAGVDITHQVTIRYRSDVTHNHRLVENGRFLDIRTVIEPEERHERLELLCAEVEPR